MKYTSLLLFMLMNLLFILTNSASSFISHTKLCHDNESSALLHFKESFIIDMDASVASFAYPKVVSWKLQTDCCSWEGVECDNITGHVVGLDVSSSFLYGSINSTSTIFQLVHLRYLNLADNSFKGSAIPPRLGQLSRLTYLDLSFSAFSGLVPPNVSALSRLSYLDLSGNNQLALKNLDFRRLVQNLTGLEVLHLDGVDMSSTLPENLANSSYLTSIRLISCRLYGEFPTRILQLPKLEELVLPFNQYLTGHLPDFHLRSPLRTLGLAYTSFAGEIPASIGNLNSLTELDLQACKFSGQVPSSLGNLTELDFLSLSENSFEDPISSNSLSWVGNLSKVAYLDLSNVKINGEIPSFFSSLTNLFSLRLSSNQFTGPFPFWLMNLTQLTKLDLSFNGLQGPIPSISKLKNLEYLNLFSNKFGGKLELDMFLKLTKLSALQLGMNKLSLQVNTGSNATLHKFTAIGFGQCNLIQIPNFLRHQDELQFLDLRHNHIYGQIPTWLWNTSTDTLRALDLSENFLTGFETHPNVFPFVNAAYIDLSANMIQASLPLPPPLVRIYALSSNNFIGEISPFFCNLSSLYALDLSKNKLSGTLPSCLSSVSSSMEVLDLGRNNLHGSIPQEFTLDCNLKTITLSGNQIEGQVPRSLANCKMLEFLNLGNNQINDVFPSWLGALTKLKVLILRTNRFHGVLKGHDNETKFDFSDLGIIDLSQNNFTGQLPMHYFHNWIAMKKLDADESTYMGATFNTQGSTDFGTSNSYQYSMSMINKGTELEYRKILEFFVAIDLSCNRFEGHIPPVIGSLHGLRLLNLSNNNLRGRIPSSLGDLTKLESLDLSQNRLSAEIPQQLTQLTFLAVFNVSYNNLTGPIPLGKQFDTFQNDSYLGNSGLCGNPLSKKCRNSQAMPTSPSSSALEFGSKPVVMGYCIGLVVGLVIGHIFFERKYEWFARIFRLRVGQQRIRRLRR